MAKAAKPVARKDENICTEREEEKVSENLRKGT